MKKAMAVLCTLALAMSLTVEVQAKSFTDTENHWAAAEIDQITEMGLFNGTSATTFNPQGSMTRAMFVTVLGRAAEKLGLSTEASGILAFTDVPENMYYSHYVKWAYGVGIVNGVDAAHFNPNSVITRQQMCAIYVRFLDWCGYNLSAYEKTNAVFADAGMISAYAKDAVKIASSMGLVQGSSRADGSVVFNPQGSATRAAVAVVTTRLMNQIEDLKLKTEEAPVIGGGIPSGGGAPGTADTEQNKVAESLRNILKEYQNSASEAQRYLKANCGSTEKQLISDVMHVVDQALRSKVDLSPDSIRAKYAAEISKANATYSELDSAAEGKVNAVMMLLGTPEEIQLLSTFFGVSF